MEHTYQGGAAVFEEGTLVDYEWDRFSYPTPTQALSAAISLMLSDPRFDRVYLCKRIRDDNDEVVEVVDLDSPNSAHGEWARKKYTRKINHKNQEG